MQAAMDNTKNPLFLEFVREKQSECFLPKNCAKLKRQSLNEIGLMLP